MVVDRRRRGRKEIDPWKFLSSAVSGIFMTIGVFLLLLALAEIIVYLIDSILNGNESYLDWWSTPLMMVLMSIPFFLAYIFVNLPRYAFYRKIQDSIRVPGMSREPRDRSMDKIELD